VPLSVLERSIEVLELAREAAARGNQNSLSDAGVAALCARAAAEGAWLNVLINLKNLSDEGTVRELRRRGEDALVRARVKAGEVLGMVESALA